MWIYCFSWEIELSGDYEGAHQYPVKKYLIHSADSRPEAYRYALTFALSQPDQTLISPVVMDWYQPSKDVYNG